VPLAAACVTACSNGGDQRPSERQSSLTVPLPPVTQFVVLATRSASFGDRTQVTGGHLGVAAAAAGAAANTLSGGIDTRIGVGEVLVAQTVVLLDRAATGEIGANTITASAGVTTGPRSAFVAPPPGPTPGAVTPGAAAVTVNVGQTQTLAAGRFGAVTVNGTLNLAGGLYELQSLRLGAGARLAAQARSTVRVATGLAAGDRAVVVPVAPLHAGDLHITAAGTIDTGGNSITFGTDGQLTAVVVARNSFRAGDRLTAAGAIAAQDVILGLDSKLAFDTGFGCGSNASCDDANVCTTDACVDAQCAHTPAPAGTACSDGNACTQADTCQAGVCVGGNAVTCAASDQCHVAGVCNPATGVCSNPTVANGTACSDGNACTQTDTCQAGACVGGPAVTCRASDQCHVAGVCNPATGVCSNPTAANGTACSDGNACTQADTCQAGACVGGTGVTCAASDQCHVAGVCNPATGACSNPIAANGTACSDGNACTQADTCQVGVCVGGPAVTCAASDQCHVAGVCNPATGACSNPIAANGIACNDGNACTQADTCQAGACMGGAPVTCTASDQCHVAGTCNPATGACSNPPGPDGRSCSDGNACTTGDVCRAGACVGAPVTCTASDQCHVAGMCNPATGACSNPTGPDGTSCSDGSACTTGDVCRAGTCVGAPVVCTAVNGCHAPGTCDPATGACSTGQPLPEGSECNDGNACTTGEACHEGSCGGGTAVTCTASDQCHVAGSCDPTTGACSNPTAPNGTTCSDGNACTRADTCQAGACVAGSPVTCDGSSDPCVTGGRCDPASGSCVGGASTITEVASGVVQPTTIVSGPDGNLWFISPESAPGAADGKVVRIDPTSTTVTPFATHVKLTDITPGLGDDLWMAEVMPSLGGLTALGHITTTGVLMPDVVGILADRVVAGPDRQNIWYASHQDGFDLAGSLTAADLISSNLLLISNAPRSMTGGPDGNVWITESNGGDAPALIGRVTAAGVLTEFPVSTPGDLNVITLGPDGNLWFTDPGRNEIGRVTPAGTITKFAVPTPASGLFGIVAGRDGNLWFTESTANRLGRITPAGVVTELGCIPTPASGPSGIASGSDGRIWFTETASGKLGAVRLP
jgi:streptogramin lyase